VILVSLDQCRAEFHIPARLIGEVPEPYTRQEIFTGAFAGILQELVIPPVILEWLGDTVLESDRTEQAAREQAIGALAEDPEHPDRRTGTHRSSYRHAASNEPGV
jgi:hypothetical protein